MIRFKEQSKRVLSNLYDYYHLTPYRPYRAKLENELGWKADENFDSGIVKTAQWYLNKYNKENNEK